MKKEPTISLCMIVKNEEKLLPDCLKSVQGCTDEVIVVDTGSTDRTVEIARSFGAEIYHHPWENDFSRHRNQSMGYAKGDWILIMDADEALEPGGDKSIRRAVKSEGIDSLAVVLVCYFENRMRESWNNSIRLFKNGLGIHYEGFVHNQVVGCENTKFCSVKLYHYGYDLDQKNVKNKFERTSKLLKKAIQLDPDNFRHHHDLAVSYASVHLFQKAVEEGLTALELYEEKGCSDPNVLWTHFVVASSYFNLHMMDEAMTLANKAIEINPEHFDSHFVLASIYGARKEKERFEQVYAKILRLITKYRANPEILSSLIVNKIGEKWRLDMDYGCLLLEGGLEGDAEEWLLRAADQAPEKSQAYRLASISCRENEYLSLAENFLQKASNTGLKPQTAAFERAMIMKVSGRNAEYESMIEALLSSEDIHIHAPELMSVLGTEALRLAKYQMAESLLTASLEVSYDLPGVFISLALACKYQGKTKEAIAWNLRALDMNGRDVNALASLGHLYFDDKMWNSARSCYENAFSLDESLTDALFRLSLLALMEQDIEICIKYCDRLMKLFDIPVDMVIDSIYDLAFVYRSIATALSKNGEQRLHSEAMNLAVALEEEASMDQRVLP